MNFIAKALISTLLFCSVGYAQVQNSWVQVYEKSKPSIGVIISGGVVCSGALIEKDLVLTSAHCVDQIRKIHVYFRNESWKMYEGQRLQMDSSSDLALIKLNESLEFPKLKILPRIQFLFEGQPISTVGHPVTASHFKIQALLDSDYLHVISSGVVSKISRTGFVSDMSVSPGNSGGPVFDVQGNIVGVVSRKRIDRFAGDLGFFSSHLQIYALLDDLKNQKKYKDTWTQARSSAQLYLLYASPNYRKDREGNAKSYWNLGLALDIWDRLRVSLDTNLDTKEAFTQYGLGWNFLVSTRDPLQSYKLIPAVEVVKFRYLDPIQNDKRIEKITTAASVTVKSSGFPLFLKVSAFELDKKSYSVVGLGLSF